MTSLMLNKELLNKELLNKERRAQFTIADCPQN